MPSLLRGGNKGGRKIKGREKRRKREALFAPLVEKKKKKNKAGIPPSRVKASVETFPEKGKTEDYSFSCLLPRKRGGKEEWTRLPVQLVKRCDAGKGAEGAVLISLGEKKKGQQPTTCLLLTIENGEKREREKRMRPAKVAIAKPYRIRKKTCFTGGRRSAYRFTHEKKRKKGEKGEKKYGF